MSYKIPKWCILHPGYNQDRNRVTGLELIWLDGRKESDEETCIQYREWNDDHEGMADMIWRNSPSDVIIKIISYSWGGGWGAIQLARALLRRGLRVAVIVACDPVYRSPYLIMRWRSLINRGPLAPKIIIPRNVDRVIWFRQKQNKPQGHDIVCEGDTEVFGPYWVDAEHAYMDEHEAFRNAALDAIRGV